MLVAHRLLALMQQIRLVVNVELTISSSWAGATRQGKHPAVRYAQQPVKGSALHVRQTTGYSRTQPTPPLRGVSAYSAGILREQINIREWRTVIHVKPQILLGLRSAIRAKMGTTRMVKRVLNVLILVRLVKLMLTLAYRVQRGSI